jgi:hypothetical protein
VRFTPLRVSLAVVATGAAIVIGGLALGDAPTQSSRPPADTAFDIVPHPGDEPEVTRGSPGSSEQVALFGGLIVALGTLGVLGSVSSDAARRAREQAAARSGTEPEAAATSAKSSAAPIAQ